MIGNFNKNNKLDSIEALPQTGIFFGIDTTHVPVLINHRDCKCFNDGNIIALGQAGSGIRREINNV